MQNVGGSTIYEFETKAIDDLITTDRMVDTYLFSMTEQRNRCFYSPAYANEFLKNCDANYFI